MFAKKSYVTNNSLRKVCKSLHYKKYIKETLVLNYNSISIVLKGSVYVYRRRNDSIIEKYRDLHAILMNYVDEKGHIPDFK